MLILTTCYSSIQSYFKIDLDLTIGTLSKRRREARRRHLYYGVTKSQRFVVEFCLFGLVFGLPLETISFKLISNTIDTL